MYLKRLKQGRIRIIQVSGSCRDEDEDAFALNG